MKSGLSWNLRGVDEETREAVLEAARRSGLTVGQWLNSVLSEDGVEHGEPDDLPAQPPDATAASQDDDDTRDAAELAEAIETVTKRLGALDDKARASIPGLKARLDEIEKHVGALSEATQTTTEQRQSLKSVSALIDALSADITAADRASHPAPVEPPVAAAPTPAPTSVPAPIFDIDFAKGPTIDLDRVTEAISELDQRIAAMGQKLAATPPAPDPRPLRLDDIRVRLDALLAQAPRVAAQPVQTAVIESALKTLESRIDSAKAQLEARLAAREAQAQAQSATTEQIGRIEERLAEIGSRITAAEEDRRKAAELEAELRKPKKEAVLSTAIREISAHQRSIDDRAETIAMRRDQKTLAAAMAALRNEIQTLAEQVTVISRVGAEEHGAFFELTRRIDAMAAEKPVDRGLLTAIHSDLETMRGMVNGAAREETLGALESRHEDMAAQLSDLLRIAPDREKLEGLGEEVAALRQSLEADESPRAIARLEERVAELSKAIGTTVTKLQQPDPAVARLEDRLEDIASHVARLNESTAQTTALATAEQRLQERMDEIAGRLGGLFVSAAKPQTAAIEHVERKLDGRLNEISTRLSNFADARLQTEAIEKAQRQLENRLEDIVGRLGAMFDTSTQDAALEHVHERLQAITERIERLSNSQNEPSAALDAIKSEIGALRAEIAGKETPAATTDHLESQIRSLAEQLNTVSGSTESEVKALADLEAQVAHLASELELNKPRPAALKQVEERLDRLQSLLADTANESIQTARSEARKAVDELADVVAGNDIDSGLVHGLMRDLDSLRNAAGSTDTATRAKLESVSATMAQVVDRLSRLEQETSVAPQARATGTYGTAPAVANFDPQELLWKSGFRPAAESAPAKTAAATPAEPEKPAQAEKKPLDRRADFIAAARRAAQAAAHEAAQIEATARDVPDVMPETAPRGERKPGAFSRISQAIRNRKRPLLLAAAAIVLAIGAMQLYGKVAPGLGGKAIVAKADTPIATVVAPVEPPTKFRDVLASTKPPVAPTTASAPTVAAAPLVPPSATPDSAIAFAPPTTTDNHFTSGITPPLPTTDMGDDVAATTLTPPPAAAPPAAPAADPTVTAGPVVLASAEVPAPDAASTLDSRLGSPKLLNAAESGDPAAAFEIATRYAEGTLVSKDLAKAAEWYTKAADGGVAVAQYRLGSFYERGQGVAKDLTKAVDWYQRAADQGNVNAMHNLAVLMSEGVDGQPDHDKALQWFLAAGNYGVRDSQYNLGVIYARGIGTGQDLTESYKWFAVAAQQGDSDASARRDEVAKVMSADDLAKARAAAGAWHVKAPIAEANAVAVPDGGWDGPGEMINSADRQDLVKKIQTLLAEAGYDPGPADGVAGPKTVDAVRAYQRTAGVPETGQIDLNLMASLSDTGQ